MFLRPIILESPFRGNNLTERLRNTKYTQLCFRECILRYGDVPFASHLLYPQCLDEDESIERYLGIQGNFVWTSLATFVVCYTDLGISKGMEMAIENARIKKKTVEYRNLYKPWFGLLKG